MQNTKRLPWIALTALPILALVLAIGPAQAQQEPADAADPACTFDLTPDQVQSESGSIELEVALTQEVGDLNEVKAETESGLSVLDIKLEGPEIAVITLDTAQAQPGAWHLVFNGEAGSCKAALTVT